MTAMVSRRSSTTWVRTRRACRLFGTSVRNRASAVSSATTSSEATSQAVRGDHASTSVCRTNRRHGLPTA